MKMTRALAAALGCTLSLTGVGAGLTLDKSVMSDRYWEIWNDAEQARIDSDIRRNRQSDAAFAVEAPDGTEVAVEQLDSEFGFGAHIFNFNQLGKKEWNDAYKASYGRGGLFNQATVAFYWKNFEPQPGNLRAHGLHEDTEAYWNALSLEDAQCEPNWRRPAPGPVIDFLKYRDVRIHGHILIWGSAKPYWIYDWYCPESEKRALDALGIPRHSDYAYREIAGGGEHFGFQKPWCQAWQALYEKMSEEEIAAKMPIFTANMRKVFRKRVMDVGRTFGAVVDSWDIVNESSRDWARYGNSRSGLPVWKAHRYGIMPGDYPLHALLDAKEALPPTADLCINDYHIDDDFRTQVAQLEREGAKIDVVGCQMHIFSTNDCMRLAQGATDVNWVGTPDIIRARLNAMARTGHPLHVSEVTISAPGTDARSRMIQAILTRNIYRAWFAHPATRAITWWNTVDGGGVIGEPLVSGLFTRDMKKKPVYEALDDLINREWRTSLTVPVSDGVVSFRGFRGRYRLSWKGSDGKTVARLVELTGKPTRDFGIAAFGARADAKCTAAFAAAVEAASQAGGGRVVVPRGRWLTGPIHLKSNVELHLAEGAEVVFSQDVADYLPAVFTTWEGVECWNYSPLVYAYGCTNVAITGSGASTLRAYEGTFEGSVWGKWAARGALTRLSRRKLYDWGATDVPVEKRRLSDLRDSCTRPQFIQFNRCRNVRLENFRVRESPFWTIHLYLCDGIVARDLDVAACHSNNDGIDIEMTRNVLVERCTFDQGDDTFVIKSGRNRDAWRLHAPTENVEIRHCHMNRAHSFFTIGSEISGGVRNVCMHDCSVAKADRLCFVKTNRRRGAFVEGVRVKDVTCGTVGTLFGVSTDVLYEWADFPDYELRTTRIGNLSLENVSCGVARTRVDIQGNAVSPVRGVTLDNVRAGRVRVPDRFVNAANVVEDGVPVKTSKEFPITDYGAKPDGSDSSAAIGRAVAAAAHAGGGRVFVPSGTWTTGPIALEGGVELNLISSATLRFTDDPKAYAKPGGGYRPLISAEGAACVRLSGYGRIEALTDGWQVVPKSARPSVVRLSGCRGVCLEQLSFRNAPARVVEVTGGEDVLVSGVEFIAQVEENDFIVSQAAAGVAVEACSFRIGDGRLNVLDPSHRLVHPNRLGAKTFSVRGSNDEVEATFDVGSERIRKAVFEYTLDHGALSDRTWLAKPARAEGGVVRAGTVSGMTGFRVRAETDGERVFTTETCAAPPLAEGVRTLVADDGDAVNVRNGEGDTVMLMDGRMMFAYTHFTKRDQVAPAAERCAGTDFNPASIWARISPDGGRTWNDPPRELIPNDAARNLMCVSFLRLKDGRLAIFYLRKNGIGDCRPVMRTSEDEGESWSEWTACVSEADKGYYVMNNGRVVRDPSGRILLPMALHRMTKSGETDSYGEVVCAWSDDEGETWKLGAKTCQVQREDGHRTAALEPGLVALRDGSLLMNVRARDGFVHFLRSTDRGETWTPWRTTPVFSPSSPATVARLSSGELVMVYNDHQDRAVLGSWRTPLVIAVSTDEGATWGRRKSIEDDLSKRRFCYTSVREHDGLLYLSYYSGSGLRCLRLKSVPVASVLKE